MFELDDGTPVPAVTAAEMREVDRVAVEETGPPLLSMMENAGRNLAASARELADGAVVVFAGGGGNGGGGCCCARHLANHGAEVGVVLDRSPDDLEGVTAMQVRVLQAMDVPVVEAMDVPIVDATDGLGDESPAPVDADLAVDALVGYGIEGSLRGRAADLVAAVEAADRVLSLDVPSGVDATTGEAPGAAVTPDRTLTLALPKAGLAEVGGDLLLGDIGIHAAVYERAGIDYTSPFDGRYRVRLDR